MRRFFLGLLAVSIVGCGFPESEEELIPDSDLDEIEVATSRSELASQNPTTPATGGFHLRLAWGYLAGKRNPGSWVDWSGGVAVDDGALTLENLSFFDYRDATLPSQSAASVSWRSRTGPHFDGLVVRVEPSETASFVRLSTRAFQGDWPVAELASGVEKHVVIDSLGHEVSVSSIPIDGCGFAFGYERSSSGGWLAFGGIVTNASGKAIGRLRFRGDQHGVKARLIGPNKTVIATGTGKLNAHGFEVKLTKPDGTSAGLVRGIYRDPSYSLRGSFQASVSCP